MRLVRLGSLSWPMGLIHPLFTIAGFPTCRAAIWCWRWPVACSWWRSRPTSWSSAARSPAPSAAPGAQPTAPGKSGNFGFLLAQILTLDIVFSLDSVITAVGMARQLSIMATAVVIAVAIMLLAANAVSEFITRHPSLKVLALSFLLMVGVLLVADAFGKHIGKGYLYFAMAYALGVELFNIRREKYASGNGRQALMASLDLSSPSMKKKVTIWSSGRTVISS